MLNTDLPQKDNMAGDESDYVGRSDDLGARDRKWIRWAFEAMRNGQPSEETRIENLVLQSF
jgi:hypothetical protein